MVAVERRPFGGGVISQLVRLNSLFSLLFPMKIFFWNCHSIGNDNTLTRVGVYLTFVKGFPWMQSQ